MSEKITHEEVKAWSERFKESVPNEYKAPKLRCKNCEFYKPTKSMCSKYKTVMEITSFCGYGGRK